MKERKEGTVKKKEGGKETAERRKKGMSAAESCQMNPRQRDAHSVSEGGTAERRKENKRRKKRNERKMDGVP